MTNVETNPVAKVEAAEPKEGGRNLWRSFYMLLVLILFNAMVTVGPFFGLAGGLIGLWAGGVAMFVAGAALFFAALLSPIWPALLPVPSFAAGVGSIFAGAGLAALGLLMGIGLYYVTVWGYKLTVKYLKFNWRIIQGQPS